VGDVPLHHLSAADPDHRRGDDVSVLFTFTDFQLIWAMTRGGPVNATHLMATLSYQRAIIAGQLGEAPRSPAR